jgi:multisubunit Na+/H+ antiporter MnhB subunit
MEKETKEIAEFDVQDLLSIGMVFVVLVIGLSIGLQVVSSVGSNMTANSYERNATNTGLAALNVFVSNLGTIALVIVAAVIIGILFKYMMGR